MQLHLALDGEQGAAAPFEWAISTVCEEFDLGPTAALRELYEAPYGLIADILELRGYARMKAALEAAKGTKREEELYATPAGQRVFEVETLIVAWKREQRAREVAEETLGM